jgi:GDP-L-fucose synthase
MKILITGANGMVGSAFRRIQSSHELVFAARQAQDSNTYAADLMNFEETRKLISDVRPDSIIHLAAKVGGIKSNMDNMGEFFYKNIILNTNVLEAARVESIPKVVSLLSTCVYPDKVSYPLTEQQIHNGEPHSSNYGYAFAKRMLDVQSRAYREQYGCNFITAIPNNLFGENDNFDLENSHVIPAIIRKVYEANLNNDDVILWGDGSPLREFTYSMDLARALLILVEKYDSPTPINIGNTREISIKELAEEVASLLKFKGTIRWDTDKPAGQFRKPSSNSRFLNLCDMYYTSFGEALKKTCDWFIMNYPNVRGV